MDRQDWLEAMKDGLNLTETLLLLGDVSSAVRQGEQSVEVADRCDAFNRKMCRARVASILDAVGAQKAALAAFEDAESIQRASDPQHPYLYSFWGHLYCEFLLNSLNASNLEMDKNDPAKSVALLREIRDRAEFGLYAANELNHSVLTHAQFHLTLGRTWQLSARLECARSSGLSPSSPVASSDPEPSELRPDREIPVVAESPDSQAEHHLTQSVTLLRQAGTQHHLPRGLLHRAALWREMLAVGPVPTGRTSDDDSDEISTDARPVGTGPTDYLANAERDLSEAETIAERGSMLIWQIEAALERTRLFLTLASTDFVSSCLRVSPAGDTDDSHKDTKTRRDWLELAREKLDEAQRLVKQTEKPYEPHVPDWDEWEPPAYVGVFKAGDVVGYHCRNDEIERLQSEIDALDVDQ